MGSWAFFLFMHERKAERPQDTAKQHAQAWRNISYDDRSYFQSRAKVLRAQRAQAAPGAQAAPALQSQPKRHYRHACLLGISNASSPLSFEVAEKVARSHIGVEHDAATPGYSALERHFRPLLRRSSVVFDEGP